MRMPTAAGAFALTAAVALCAGCALVGRHSLPHPLPTDVPFAYHLQTQAGRDGAPLEGTLELQDGCLVVMPMYEGMEEPVVPVVPIASASWDGTTLTLNGESTAVGEQISLGGGYDAEPPDDAFVPEGCPPAATDRYFTVGLE